jgi:hypothetical protein
VSATGRRVRVNARAALTAACCLLACPAHAGLTEATRLSAAYDTILAARFDQASAQLTTTCPPAPAQACSALRVVNEWWRIQIDPSNRDRDEELRRLSAQAAQAARTWTEHEPNRAEAWFYLAGSYAPLVQLRVLRGERIAAARDGNRIREYLERALRLDSTLQDAYFGIGLYHYYADVVPAALKFFRVFLLLPGGDRTAGLREMLQARERGELLKGEADYQMHWLYLWYEHDTPKSLALLRSLDARYPSNPLFMQGIAEIQRDYLHDRSASAASWRDLLDRAVNGRVESRALIESRARRALDQLK